MTSLIGSEKIFDALQDMGVNIAIDDFGTGYSSLSRLRSLPIHTLKIDRSFINQLMENSDDRTIVASILGLARNLSIEAVAEGVETERQMQFLRDNGCENVQGFYFSKPMKIEEIKNLINSKKNHKS